MADPGDRLREGHLAPGAVPRQTGRTGGTDVYARNVLQGHICLLYDSPEWTPLFPLPQTQRPFYVYHVQKIFRFAAPDAPERNDFTKYSTLPDGTVLWTVPFSAPRVIDLSAEPFCHSPYGPSPDRYRSSIDSIVERLFEQRVLYLVNYPDHYYTLLEDVEHEYHTRLGQ